MKTILVLLSFVFVSSCVTSGVKTRAVASEAECNIENYQDFINRPGVHNCDLRDADLSGADLRGANLQGANLERADLQQADLLHAHLKGASLRLAKVTKEQAEYLESQGYSGFVVWNKFSKNFIYKKRASLYKRIYKE